MSERKEEGAAEATWTVVPSAAPLPSAAAPRGAEPPLPSRYEDLGLIAGGASAEVRRVRDLVLDRVIAMKVLRAAHAGAPRLRARFLAEARVTANLQHPGIVAVHDRGELDDGRLWFTMREIRGRTLREVIDELQAAAGPEGFRDTPSGLSFRRVVDGFARIAQAVGYAHSRGVVHRDLKPDNLMVGEFGEVLVMDWGLARRAAAEPPGPDPVPSSGGGAVSEDLPDGLTQQGDVLGTPAYMPPEQARGELERHGPESDVYALGAVLYHLLAGRPPYRGSSVSVWQQVLAGPPPPLTEVARRGPPLPPELVAICERAMQRDPAARYPDGGALAREVLGWLDGARRREQALEALAQARELLPGVADLRARAAQRRAEARAALGEVRPFEPIERKRPGWTLEDEAEALERGAAVREAEWLRAVHGALSLDPELPEAHAALADHYRDGLLEAERAGRDADAARCEALLREHDRGRHPGILSGEGALTLVTDPPGAVVRLERYVLHDRRLVPEDLGELGRTPLRAVSLPRGSYRLRVAAPGRAEVFYPVLIERGQHWDGCAPGESEPRPIRLPGEDELGPGEVYVPAGYAWTGGDPAASDSLPAQRVWIEAFFLGRFPVTNREYLDFLNALVAEGREAEALWACPRSQLGMGDAAGERLMFGRDGRGYFTPAEDELGRAFQPDWPVVLVDWHGTLAYTRWLAEVTGRPYRLPDELEREKAARGVDGRHFPWGNHPEPTFTCALDSQGGEPSRAEVRAYAVDESPYGARGLAGNVRDWCGNVWRHQGPLVDGGRLRAVVAAPDDPDFRAVRGGAWSSALQYSRAATRFGNRPALRRTTTGLRVARGAQGQV